MDAHKLYTKTCPNCRVAFTHECLLTTHTISKCGSKEEKLSRKGENKTINFEGKTESETEKEDDVEGEAKSQRMNGYHGDASSLNRRQENEETISSSLLAHLNSPLPLLTLLQIQKTQAERAKEEEHEEINVDSEPPPMATKDQYKIHESDSSSNECLNPPAAPYPSESAPKRKMPPLIPTELVKPLVNNAARFAILRQLLSNYQNQSALERTESQADSVVSDTSIAQDVSHTQKSSGDYCDTEEAAQSETEFKPRNIPEHLYKLLDNKNGLHHHNEESANSENLSGNEDFGNEAEPLDAQLIRLVRNKDNGDEDKKASKALDEEKGGTSSSYLKRYKFYIVKYIYISLR